ncbi:FAD-dependent oxidoreductase [Bacillus sp. HMF5848]|uniref:FAD-dependent oxidoreductase n=1 Tax=Bacillus sp. HMF5848 TaxID=2495421 RepID=UPI000F783DF7|nr:FAD-dependent oxidoreductase [Bacillus sp. HMF5848]RSK26696.1 FAD-dependent oxidoreductase [Bacillus sp. HMF5848]
MTEHSFLPQFPEPYWRDGVSLPSFPTLHENIEVDVCIVGAGITGITLGYLLSKQNISVAIIEASQILNGTTGHTTAKLTAQHGLIYDQFINQQGLEKAKQYFESNMRAIQFVRDTAQSLQIDCDLSEQDAVVYTNDDNYLHKLEKEKQAYEQIGIESQLVDSIPIPVQMKSALVMKQQAQFHPIKYLTALTKEITNAGGKLYEHTTASDIQKGQNPKVTTRNGQSVTCKHVAICSHFPFYDGNGFYFARMYPKRSYLLAIKSQKTFPGGMYITAENPTRSLRSATYNGEEIILIAGEGHKAGHGKPEIQHYEALYEFGHQVFGVDSVLYRWSAHDLFTLDDVPYVGEIRDNIDNIFIATGYRKWGMSNGIQAAHLLADKITSKTNSYEDLYKPNRFHTNPDIKNFITTNSHVAYHFVKGKLDYSFKNPEDLKNDEAGYITVNGQRAGAYRDEFGELHVVDTTCKHLGCEVNWNSGDRTWDCPCHGSRFSIDGEVIEGPSKKPLDKINDL